MLELLFKNLRLIDFRGARLNEADLREADLTKARLNGADLREADLTKARLTGADLSGSDLRGSDLRGADLVGVDLSGANLRGADLRGAWLNGANLRGADLRGAWLNGSNLIGSNLTGADTRGANLHEAGVMIITTLRWPVQIDAQYMRIGCKLHTHDEWRAFDDATIDAMDASAALVFWQEWRGPLLGICGTLANARELNQNRSKPHVGTTI